MKRFVFNLETVLRHRMNLEEKERNELSRIRYEFQTEVNRRDDLRGRLRETSMELSRLRSENADIAEVTWYYPYLERLRHEIQLSDKRIVQLDGTLQAQMLVVIEATKKRKVLDSLKTRKHQEFTLAADRQEQKNIDEIVVTRYARKDR